MTVLVVEDDNIIREGLQISLRQDGYDVLTAATQNAALDTISGNQTIDVFFNCFINISRYFIDSKDQSV